MEKDKKDELELKNVRESDGSLIESYLDGNMEAFNEIYEKYKRQLYGYLRRILPGKDSLYDDIFQQTWLKAIANFKYYKEDEKFLAWLMRISHNLAMDHFRKYSRESLEDIGSMDNWSRLSSDKSPSRELSLKETRENLDNCIEKLPDKQREVFLFRADDISFKEIAKMQKCSINTALARMQYALKSLRNCLKNRMSENE